jgi:hypothetical protein
MTGCRLREITHARNEAAIDLSTVRPMLPFDGRAGCESAIFSADARWPSVEVSATHAASGAVIDTAVAKALSRRQT